MGPNLRIFANRLTSGRARTLKILGAGLLIVTIFFAISGFNSWRADRRAVEHQKKACQIIYGLGFSLTDNSLYGDGINTVTPEVSAKLDNAVEEAFAAADADMEHYTIFRDAVILFAMNLRGDGSLKAETLHSPYELYTYAIDPACSNYMYLGE